MHSTTFDDPWRAENLENLRALAGSLKERVKAGDLNARLPLQVVVVVIAELDAPHAAASES